MTISGAFRRCGRAAVVLLTGIASAASAAPVAGVVSYDGRSVPEAIVSFTAIESGRRSASMTDEKGGYELDGLPAGSYIVFIDRGGRRIYEGQATVGDRKLRHDIDLTPDAAETPPIVGNVDVQGGHRTALAGPLAGKVSVYLSAKCNSPCRPQLVVYRTDPDVSRLAEYTTMDFIRPILRRNGNLLFDNPIGPDRFRVDFVFDAQDYWLAGSVKGDINQGGKVVFDVHRRQPPPSVAR